MDRSQSLNVPPFFYGNNYAFWNVRIRAFLCSIDDTVWDVVEAGWTRPEATKSTWDKAALTTANANSKALNAIFCGVSPDEFHRISHITVAKESMGDIRNHLRRHEESERHQVANADHSVRGAQNE